MEINMEHFETLRDKINDQLRDIPTEEARTQMHEYPWLYGALGQVPSNVMFVCENPSLTGVERANVRTLGSEPTIEDQWCGGRKSNCVKRFRPALYELGLKTTGPLDPGGWRCYITNVIKESFEVRKFNANSGAKKEDIAEEWASVLKWELEVVAPKTVFAVGGSAARLLDALQLRRLISSFRIHDVMHYSARRSDVEVRKRMIREIRAGLGTP